MTAGNYPFELDLFQKQAISVVDLGKSVLVAAPTGSGKTVVAERAVEKALADRERAFYTTPIKALSNQKYRDLVARHGEEAVGLLTGDNTINPNAPVVVMTTEVLRNMLYADKRGLEELGWVVLDEVHYLQDPYRGPVWEEIILGSPQRVRFVCLSATVSNLEELGDWITTVRGPVAVVVNLDRPVELRNLYMVGDATAERSHLIPTLVDGQANPEGNRFDDGNRHRTARKPRKPRRRFHTPSPVDIIHRLAAEDMLPALYFIFSRAGCDQAAQHALHAGVRLTDRYEQERIRAIADEHLAALNNVDLAALDYAQWMTAMEAGIAAHHAGLVPAFKEAAEACFAEGLVKVVFATETLALGINMPARTVVIDKLTKFNGDRHQFLTPLQYTQITGRAGRRGLDHLGHAVALWSPFVRFNEVASLASSKSYPLRSAFRPTYNMVANLIRSHRRSQALELLNLSLGQFQADREVVHLEQRLRDRKAQISELRQMAVSDRGDVFEYLDILGQANQEARDHRDEIVSDVAALRPGDIIDPPGERTPRVTVVLSVAQRKNGSLRVRTLTGRGQKLALSGDDFIASPVIVGHLRLPEPYVPNDRKFQQAVVRLLNRAELRTSLPSDLAPGSAAERASRHPVADDPNLKQALGAARRLRREEAGLVHFTNQMKSRRGTLVLQFDALVELLKERGYVQDWGLTKYGDWLTGVYHESDLLVGEAMRHGVLDDLSDQEMAGIVSVLTYEHRSRTPPPVPAYPSKKVRDRVEQLEALARRLQADERRLGISPTRLPSSGFLTLAYAWAAGAELHDVLTDEMSGGDFVRNMKQIVDLLRQISHVAPNADLAAQATRVAEWLMRGVVAASAMPSTGGWALDRDVERAVPAVAARGDFDAHSTR